MTDIKIDRKNVDLLELKEYLPSNASTTAIINENRVLVISYDVEILELDKNGRGYFNEKKFSKTTTRLQNCIRNFLDDKKIKY